MFIDAQNLFSDAQSLTATAASTNVIDLKAERKLGTGEPMAVVIVFDVALAGTTPTFAAALQSDSADSFGSAATVATSPTLSAAAAGYKLVLPIPPGIATESYVRLYYTLGGTSPTATVTAFLTAMSMIQNDAVYADNITIS